MELLEIEGVRLVRRRTSRGLWRFGSEAVVLAEELDLSVDRQECVALVSQSREALRALGLAVLKAGPVESGSIRFGGIDLAGLDESRFRPLRRRIQGLFPDSLGQLPADLTAREAFRQILEIWHRRAPREEREHLVEAAMVACGLPEAVRDLRPLELDSLERQLVALARALLSGPELLVCVSPTEGLDAVQASELLQRLRRVHEERGLALLLLVDDFSAARAIATEAAILHQGRVVERGDLATLSSRPRHEHTRRLAAHAA